MNCWLRIVSSSIAHGVHDSILNELVQRRIHEQHNNDTWKGHLCTSTAVPASHSVQVQTFCSDVSTDVANGQYIQSWKQKQWFTEQKRLKWWLWLVSTSSHDFLSQGKWRDGPTRDIICQEIRKYSSSSRNECNSVIWESWNRQRGLDGNPRLMMHN